MSTMMKAATVHASIMHAASVCKTLGCQWQFLCSMKANVIHASLVVHTACYRTRLCNTHCRGVYDGCFCLKSCVVPSNDGNHLIVLVSSHCFAIIYTGFYIPKNKFDLFYSQRLMRLHL